MLLRVGAASGADPASLSIYAIATRSNCKWFYLQRVQLFSLTGSLQIADDDLVHFEHGFHYSFRLQRIGVSHHLSQDGGDNLPGQTVFVFQPAASAFLSVLRKLLPKFVHFLLGLAVHNKGYGFREFECRATV